MTEVSTVDKRRKSFAINGLVADIKDLAILSIVSAPPSQPIP